MTRDQASLDSTDVLTKLHTCDELIVADVVLHLTGAPSLHALVDAQSAGNIASIRFRQGGKSRAGATPDIISAQQHRPQKAT